MARNCTINRACHRAYEALVKFPNDKSQLSRLGNVRINRPTRVCTSRLKSIHNNNCAVADRTTDEGDDGLRAKCVTTISTGGAKAKSVAPASLIRNDKKKKKIRRVLFAVRIVVRVAAISIPHDPPGSPEALSL